jgi:hypothetical protein
MSPRGRNPYGDSVRVITLSNLSSKVTKNDNNYVIFTSFSNHYCTKLLLMPTKLGIHNPPKTCLERNPRRASFKKKIYDPKIFNPNVKICCDFWVLYSLSWNSRNNYEQGWASRPQPHFYVFETSPPSASLKIFDNTLKFRVKTGIKRFIPIKSVINPL